MPEEINNIDGRLAIETDEPMSIQEANVWALEQRSKADARKAAIERLRRAAVQRRERKPVNPLETLKPDPSYRVREFNAEADAFNVESSDGKKLLGKSLSNGNVKSGQKVRSFFAPNGQIIIDVKPKGRDIVIPKPVAAPPVKDPDIWPVTSCFLYSRIKSIEEDLTDNLATDLTSYDAYQSWETQNPLYDPTKSIKWNDRNAPRIKNSFFVQRADTLGDYETAEDALTNKLKADRTFTPPAGSDDGGAADNSAWGEGSENAVTAWFYIGDMTGWAPVERNIFYARGNGYGSWSGPNYEPPYIEGPLSPCMTMYQVGAGAIEALYASLTFGEEPLSKYLKSSSFSNLGGKIGYWGGVRQWHGMQDVGDYGKYTRAYGVNDANGYREPTSQPPDYPGINYPAPPIVPWSFEDINWYRFGWPKYSSIGSGEILLNCSSEPGNIRVYNYGIDPFSSAAEFECGGDILGENWSGYRLGTHSTPWMQEGNPSQKSGMFVCWQGDLANLGLASSFCSALQAYFDIDNGMGGVTLLGSCNPYGCKGPPGTPGNGYPKAPLAQRVVAKQFGHKAEIRLKVCDKEKPPIELKLPFEFAAVVTKWVAQNGTLSNGQTTILTLATATTQAKPVNACERPHATMAVDKDFVYIDILYGGEREWATPQIRPVPTRLSQSGSGTVKPSDSLNSVNRVLGMKEESPKMLIVEEYNESGKELYARYKADYFTYCQSFKIALPNPSNDNQLTIVESRRYQRGQVIQITEKSPDNEFNNKFLICDFRTDMKEEELEPTSPTWDTEGLYSISSIPNPDYASFGGLPALLQGRKPAGGFLGNVNANLDESLAFFNVVPKFYKPQSVWTDMDKIHFQLQESPRMIWPGNTVLPPGEFVRTSYLYNGDVILFDDNGKFGKHGRASAITSANMFRSSDVQAPQYGETESQSFLLFTSFKEQLIGNGLKNDAGLVIKWNRLSTSSFPIFGQLPRKDFSA